MILLTLEIEKFSIRALKFYFIDTFIHNKTHANISNLNCWNKTDVYLEGHEKSSC